MYGNSFSLEMTAVSFYFAKVAHEYRYFRIFVSQLAVSRDTGLQAGRLFLVVGIVAIALCMDKTLTN